MNTYFLFGQNAKNKIMKPIRKKIAACILSLLFVLSCVLPARAQVDWPQDVEVASEGAILIDADSGAVLYGKNIHEHYFPASITKILTALIVIEHCDLNETLTFSYNAVHNVEADSSSAGFDVGDTLTVRDALYAMLLKSANEAANALAEHVSGSIEDFAKLMNEKAQSLGCVDSSFANPSGLNNPNHYTSAYDFSLISKAAFENPVFVEIDSTKYYTLPPSKNSPEGQTVYTHHAMLKSKTNFYYPNAIGGKTGYTTLAGNTLVTYARNEKIGLITVVLNGRQTHYPDTTALLDFGFRCFSNRPITGSDLNNMDHIMDNISLIPDINEVTLSLDPKGSLTLPQGEDISQASSKISYNLDASAPQGAIARISYTYGERQVGETYILAKHNAPEYVAPLTTAPPQTQPTAQTTEHVPSEPASATMPKIPLRILILVCSIIGLVAIGAAIALLLRHFRFSNEINRKTREHELRIKRRLKAGWKPEECGVNDETAKKILGEDCKENSK